MHKIESIRPGGVLESNFGEYSLAELLLGILRGNLTGALDLRLNAEPSNAVYFKDGVPIVVVLPDIQGSNIGQSSEAMRRRRAREQMVKLFDVGPIAFMFSEGRMFPDDAQVTILQPLPIVFEGLSRSRDRFVIARCVSENEAASFKLAATYPNDVDPFEWGEAIEAAVLGMKEPQSFADLVRAGLERAIAEAVVTTLCLAGMAEVIEAKIRPESQRRSQKGPDRQTSMPRGRVETPSGEASEAPGLVLHRRSPTVRGRSQDDPSIAIAGVLSPLRGKSYFSILRSTESSTLEQIDRSFRFLIRQAEAIEDKMASVALLRSFEEAFEVVTHPEHGPRYRELSLASKTSQRDQRPREAFEAAKKVVRVLSAIARGHCAEALYTIEWIQALDASRGELKLLRAMLEVFRAPKAIRANEVRAAKQLIDAGIRLNPQDPIAYLCAAMLGLETAHTGDTVEEFQTIITLAREFLRQ